MIGMAIVGSFVDVLQGINALVKSCIDCERYPRNEIGAGDVVADCSKTYVSLIQATPVGKTGGCRLYDLDVQVAIVYECASDDGAICVISDAEDLGCCFDASSKTAYSSSHIPAPGGGTRSIRYDRPSGGAHVARIMLSVKGVICCGA